MGLVVDEELAKRSGCTCHAIGPTDKPKDLICFSPGVIGTLTDEQDVQFCTLGKLIIRDDGIKKRVQRFREASAKCDIETAKYPKGEKLIPRIKCMQKELSKRGIKFK